MQQDYIKLYESFSKTWDGEDDVPIFRTREYITKEQALKYWPDKRDD